VQPGAELVVAAKPVEALVGAQQGVLDGILGRPLVTGPADGVSENANGSPAW